MIPSLTARPAGSEALESRWALWLCVVLTVVVFLAQLYTPVFIVDSWSYLELSKTVFRDFYHVNTLRQFESASPYSNAFPPLWPVLLAVVRQVADLGIFTGFALNCFVCIGLAAVLIRLFRAIGFPGWGGAACYLGLLGFFPFRSDALAAKALALSLTLVVGALLMLVRSPVTMRRVAVAALLMGLACLTRFDVLPTALVIGGLFAVCSYRQRAGLRRSAAAAILYFAILVVAIAPWSVYGITHFGTLMPSDNVRQVREAWPGNVLDYFAKTPANDLRANPKYWLVGFLFHKVPKVALGLFDEIRQSITLLLLGTVVIVLLVVRRSRTPPPLVARKGVQITLLGLALIPVMLLPAAMVGYSDSRYYAPPVLLLFGALFAVLLSRTPDTWDARRVALLLLFLTAPSVRAIGESLAFTRGRGLWPADAAALLSVTPEMRRVSDGVLRDAKGEAHRLLRTDGYIQSVRYGALTGQPTTVMPRLVGGTFAAFARDWHVTHLYNPPPRQVPGYMPSVADPDILMRVIAASGAELVPLDVPGLYRIQFNAGRGARPSSAMDTAQRVPPRPIALVHGTVIDVEHGGVIRDATVLTQGDRILYAGVGGGIQVPAGAEIIDVQGRYVVPGFWDMHVHMAADPRLLDEADATPLVVPSVRYFGSLSIVNGVSGVRDLSGDLALLRAMDSLARHDPSTAMGPRMVFTGQKLGEHPVVPGAPFPVRTADDFGRSVALLEEGGAGFVKLARRLPYSQLHMAMTACAAAQMPCVSHVLQAPSFDLLAREKMSSFEHLFLLNDYTSTADLNYFFDADNAAFQPSLFHRILRKLRLERQPPETMALSVATHDSTKAVRLFGELASEGTWVTPTLILSELLTRVDTLLPAARDTLLMLEAPTDGLRRDTRRPAEREEARREWELSKQLVRELHEARVGLLAGSDLPLQSVPGARCKAS